MGFFLYLYLCSCFSEKRQKSIRERMAAVEVGDESTYSRPQCCSNKSCDQSKPCRNSTCTLNQRANHVNSGGNPCDTHLYCYGTCNKEKGITNTHGEYSQFNPTGCSVLPKNCYMSETAHTYNQSSNTSIIHNSNNPSEIYSCQPFAGGTYSQYGIVGDNNRHFNRKYGGRHSFHGVPTAMHSDNVITFVHHHLQSSAMSPMATASATQGQNMCDRCNIYNSPHQMGGINEQCKGFPSDAVPLSPPSQCHHRQRSVVANSILEELSPCASSNSSTENLHTGGKEIIILHVFVFSVI